MEIGSVIREKRTAQGLTQEQVAHGPGGVCPGGEQMGEGVSQS